MLYLEKKGKNKNIQDIIQIKPKPAYNIILTGYMHKKISYLGLANVKKLNWRWKYLFCIDNIGT